MFIDLINNYQDEIAAAQEHFKNTSCIIFDLDGTLINTIDDLALACDYLLKQKGIKPQWTTDDYMRFVGNGAKLLVKRAFDNKLSDDELEEQYALFKHKYNQIKLDNAYIYDGMLETVKALKKNGFKLAVCTNKPDIAAVNMVEALFGKDLFDCIVGARDDLPKKPLTDMPSIILRELSVSPEACVWVGDSGVDIDSAHNLGCKSIAVSWGFRSVDELAFSSPTAVIEHPENILKIFDLDIDN